MKLLIFVFLFLTPALCGADTFLLKDGAKIEGEVAGEMEGTVLVKTKYGSLTVNKADIKQQLPAAPTPAAPAPSSAAISVEIASPTAVSTDQPAAAEPALPRLTFITITPSTTTRSLVYHDSGVAVATETFSSSGALLLLEGTVKDGTYTEYYANGGLKTVKTMSGGRAGGTFKAYYPAGNVQIEAYYLAGAKEGPFKYFSEDGKPLMQAEYKNDRLSGWKQEYDAAGAVKSEAYYLDDHLAEPPKAAAAPEAVKEKDSMVTVKVMSLARGERFLFRLNGKYIGKVHLDKNFNIISQQGKIPDGTVKVYSKEGKLQKEFLFDKSAIRLLRVYEDGGPLKGEYAFKEDKAVKK